MAVDASAAFFSYCREDSGFALRLAEDLKAAGANVWMDQLEIVPGQRWDRAVKDALANCPRLLVLLSPASVDSENVLDEIDFALYKRKTIIPVLYCDCDTPLRLRRIQYIDFRTDYARGLKALLKALGVDQPPQTVVAITPETPKERQPPASEEIDLQPTAEQQRLEEQRKQAELERFQQERWAATERVHEAELGLKRLAAEQQRQRMEQEEAKKALAPRPSFQSRLSVWGQVAIAAGGILIVALVLYWASSRHPSSEQPTGGRNNSLRLKRRILQPLARSQAPLRLARRIRAGR